MAARDAHAGVDPVAADVVSLAASRGLTLATAESCTGGLIAAAITAIPGASHVFVGGMIAYADAFKRDVLGITEVSEFGAVSSETAAAMARGVRRIAGADIALSVTGVAGPDGGTLSSPVGTVWFGVATSHGVDTELRRFSGDRSDVRVQGVSFALGLLFRAMDAS